MLSMNVWTQFSIVLYLWCVSFVTCTCFAIFIQSVSRQTEAVEGARGALTDVLTAVVRLQTQIHAYGREDIHNAYYLKVKKLHGHYQVLHELNIFCPS